MGTLLALAGTAWSGWAEAVALIRDHRLVMLSGPGGEKDTVLPLTLSLLTAY